MIRTSHAEHNNATATSERRQDALSIACVFDTKTSIPRADSLPQIKISRRTDGKDTALKASDMYHGFFTDKKN